VSAAGANSWPLVSVVVPARNEPQIARVVRAVLGQSLRAASVEVVVVDDGSSDETAQRAEAAGARVVRLLAPGEPGNAAAARNRGFLECRGDPVVFLDGDCIPESGWLDRILEAHEHGAGAVGGSLSLPPGLPIVARCDYYCGWYVIHPAATAGWVPHHPPPNLSVRRAAYAATGGFAEQPPFSFSNEERFWQAQLRAAGHRLYFEPRAVAAHYNRPGLGNFLRRNYRWAYTAVEAKSQTGSARAAWLYRHPWLLVAASPALVFAHSAYIVGCWLKVGVFEPLLMLPLVLLSRITYMAGLCVGALRWLQSGSDPARAVRHRPKWE
jgi:glycosyltransferase involved in cell wall biosynthesis